ncbi:hypothetical protein ACDZ94_24560 (plasmid) [Pseudomonas sp. UBT]|uniref:hypothetical protein n=1 Tax=Pseudomonas sp. UBT TaxID=3239198 RepID=UPI003D804614
MYTYSFAAKLTDHALEISAPQEIFDSCSKRVTVKRMANDIFLISSDGYSDKHEAELELAGMMMKLKITLLKLKVPHQDWISFNDDQRIATLAIGDIFRKANVTPISYQPQVYETSQRTHWPAAAPAPLALDLKTLSDITLPDSEFNYGTVRTLEALTVLGLALAAPHVKSKLILSMTAVEILCTRGVVEQNVVDALDALADKIPEIGCSLELGNRLKTLLEDAKRESISRACKRLVKKYLGSGKASEFYDLYNVRSQLVHGNPAQLTIDLDAHAAIEKLAEDGYDLALELTLAFEDDVEDASASIG